MIVSASYRTDIPAFYGRWFMARLAAGFCRTVNPYGGQLLEVPLAREAVDGFVFWTRNPGPFLPALEALREQGFPFVVQLTITGYPRALDAAVIEAERAIALARRLARAYGPKAVVWRYDPIVVTSITPPAWHLANFAGLARGLEGAVDEVVVSFAQIYRKTRRNLDAAARRHGFAWHDPAEEAKRALLGELVPRAREQGMRLSLCTQPGLRAEGSEEARCIDAERLAAIAGKPIAARTKGNRPGCLCAASRDIGAYESCPHGCVYCYAVASRARARERQRAHDPAGEFLLAPG